MLTIDPSLTASPISINADGFLRFHTVLSGPTTASGETVYEHLLASVARAPDAIPPGANAFWWELTKSFLTTLLRHPHSTPTLGAIDVERVLADAPLVDGSAYLNQETLSKVWDELAKTLHDLSAGDPVRYLHSRNTCWKHLGKVCLNLAENRKDPEKPFAFLATYVVGVNSAGKSQHIPFAKMVQDELAKQDKTTLKMLLEPLRGAAEQSPLLARLIAGKQIFNPQAWTAQEAFLFLKDVATFEDHGITVHVPNWWNTQKRAKPKVSITVGERKKGGVGVDALLSFDAELSLNDQKLSDEEWQSLLNATSNLIQIRGQWVEVNREDIKDVLEHWRHAQAAAYSEGLSFSEAMRVLLKLGGHNTAPEVGAKLAEWTDVKTGTWLADALAKLRDPQALETDNLKSMLHADLRPYQRVGVKWLWHLYQLGLGGCLADDMGLGKTIQVIALLLLIKYRNTDEKQRATSLLVLPASLIGNWKSEIERFAPSLDFHILHPAYTPAWSEEINCDVAITSYGFLGRCTALQDKHWDLVILDEAQAIKNPGTNQTLKIKALKTTRRLALTGTPVENRLTDLWSLFDFLNPGLLGNLAQFQAAFVKNPDRSSSANLRKLVSPYILRRLKTDTRIISDLPPKTEVDLRCGLSPRQAALYENTVSDFAKELKAVEEPASRRGIIFSYLTKFKQICNHPAQYTGTEDYRADDSGKFLALRSLAEELIAKQERLLVFTQYQSISHALSTFLSAIYGRQGLVLTGSTPIKARKQMVDQFQSPEGPPFFILSLKAGGTGLNLTAASQVLHFDRWWNPAVENQATDRAFRIGQKRAVIVHKMICIGTVEERISSMIREKRALADGILKGDQEVNVTELSDEDLIKLVALDIHKINVREDA